MKHKIILVILLLPLVSGCKRENIETYQDKDRINFWHYNNRNEFDPYDQRDSTMYTFINNTLTQDTVWVLIQAMGQLSDFDRPIGLRQTNTGEPLAMVPGVHYKPLADNPEIIMPRGKSLTYVPVVIYRLAEMKENEYKLALELVPNEHFDTGVDRYLKFVIYGGDVLTKPSNWDEPWFQAFGAWSRVKMQFLIDHVTGPIDWENDVPSLGGLFGYKSLAFRIWSKYVEEHGTFKDENDNEVIFTA